MINNLSIKSFGPIDSLQVDKLGNINVFIGENGTGKTYVLKGLYAAVNTVEQYMRGKNPMSDKDLLSDAMYWTFQAENLGSLIRKGDNTLSFSMSSDKDERFSYSFGTSTKKSIQNLTNTFEPTNVNSIFIPAKEIVSLQNVIMKSHDVDKDFGFDDTYVGLARALARTKQGRNYKEFSDARQLLSDAIGGRIDYDEGKATWVFCDSNRKTFEITLTSEGVKRAAILDLLLGNHYLTKKSTVFIDEVEANLHPNLIVKLLDILVMLAQAGLQIFLSTHSYFVIKHLYALAHRHNIDIPIVSMEKNACNVGNLREEMPDNPIIDAAIRLYKEEIEL